MRASLVAGNWKMHGSLAENQTLLNALTPALDDLKSVECAVCVPFPYLFQVQQILKDTSIAWGAQSISQHLRGAYTGEVAASMLSDFGCRFAIVGHSERRALYGETDELVAEKFWAALQAQLVPILCVGETLAERERGETERIVSRQLDAVLRDIDPQDNSKFVIAYEPVWAIGTGKTASPEQAQAVHFFIRNKVTEHTTAKFSDELTLLYGGSVKATNAADLFEMPDIDGGLIGGASLNADEFIAICNAAAPN